MEFFLECLHKVHANCVSANDQRVSAFIIIDGIDYLQDTSTPEGLGEREIVL